MNTIKPQITTINCETGEIVSRDANSQELAQLKLDQDNHAAAKAESEAKATARQAILDRLGITAEEAAILLG